MEDYSSFGGDTSATIKAATRLNVEALRGNPTFQDQWRTSFIWTGIDENKLMYQSDINQYLDAVTLIVDIINPTKCYCEFAIALSIVPVIDEKNPYPPVLPSRHDLRVDQRSFIEGVADTLNQNYIDIDEYSANALSGNLGKTSELIDWNTILVSPNSTQRFAVLDSGATETTSNNWSLKKGRFIDRYYCCQRT